MDLSKIKKYIIVILVVLEVCLIHLSYKAFSNKPIKLDEVKLVNGQNNKNKSMAIMLNDGSGEYTESTESSWPTEGYLYNNDKSGCIDSTGKEVADILTFNQTTNKVNLRVNQKVYCYLYFDKKEKPVIDKFYINDETSNKTTKEPEVTIHLKWSDPYITEYCITETNNVDSCTWAPSNGVIEINQSYTLSNGKGVKTIYTYIKDIAKGISEVKSDNIEYIPPINGSSMIDNPISGVVEPTGAAQDELATRYYGTNPPNYICFGTTNKSTCTGDQDKYMYRIIGVDKSGRYKVIKKEALNTSYAWHSSYTSDIKWPQSDLYKGLNGSYFLSNSTYMPSGWSDKIETMAWKYGNIYDATPNNATNVTAAQMARKEQAWTSTTSTKIGLMYLADYYYGLSKTGVNCSASSSTYSQCATSWMHLKQNDTSAPSSAEWTMSRYGQYSDGSYRAWAVISNGFVTWYHLTATYSVRPVFYLKPNITIDGTGTQTDPYMINLD